MNKNCLHSLPFKTGYSVHLLLERCFVSENPNQHFIIIDIFLKKNKQ